MAAKLKIDVIAKALGIKSLVDLKAGFEVVGQVIDFVSEGIQNLTEAYTQDEAANMKIISALKATGGAAGLSATEIFNMTDSIKELTGESDDAIKGAQGLMLTFTKVGKEVFPEAIKAAQDMSTMFGQDLQQSAIQLGTALNDPVAGIGRLKRIGISFTEDQKNSIKQFMAQNDIMGAQKVILDELNAEFGGVAANMRNTYGGALKALKSEQGELLEVGGKLISVFGRGIVESMIKSTKAITGFLNDADKISAIGAGFETFKAVLKDMGLDVFDKIKKAFDGLKESFSEVLPDMESNISAYDILVGALKLFGIAVGVSIKLLKLIIQYHVDWIVVLKNVGEALIAVAQALINPTKWKEAKEQLSQVKDSFVNLGKHAIENTENLISSTIDEFKKLPDGIKASVNKYKGVFSDSQDEIEKLLKESVDEQIDITNNGNKARTDSLDEVMAKLDEERALLEHKIKIENEDVDTLNEQIEAYSKLRDAMIAAGASSEDLWDIEEKLFELRKQKSEEELKKAQQWSNSFKEANQNFNETLSETQSTIANFVGEAYNTLVDGFTEIAEKMSDPMATAGEKIAALFEGLLEMTSEILEELSDMWDEHYEGQLEALTGWKESRLAEVDDWILQEMEKQGVAELSKSQQLERELAKLQTNLAQAQSAEDKAELQGQIKEKQDDIKRAKILEEAEAKKLKIQEEAAKKEEKIKKEQFEKNKAFQIAQIWINAASAVIGWWAAFASMGIPGIVLAGVMTAACHGKGVKLKLFSRKLKYVEDINVGDELLGDDDTPRIVLETYTGKNKLYKISYNDYEWTATENHSLSLTDGNNFYVVTLTSYLTSDRKLKFYRINNNKIEIIDDVNIKYIGFDTFYGFKISGNKLYKLEDNTVTHNTLAIAGVQTGIVASQTFAEGGIVQGSSMYGDRVPALVNSGELILNRAQQDNVAGQLMSGSGNTFYLSDFTIVANNPEELAVQLDDLARSEANR